MRIIVLIRQNKIEVSLLSFLMTLFGFIFSGNSYGQMITHTVNPWPCHTIDNTSSGADGVKFGDINNDGRSDLVVGWEEGGITKLYLNPGPALVKELWPSVEIGTTPNVEDAVFADIDDDGNLEVISCTEGKTRNVYVHWSPKRHWLKAQKWRQEMFPLSEGIMMWMYAETAQIDDQYGNDLLVAGKGENASIVWFEAPRKGRNLEFWKWHTVSPVGWIMSIIPRDMDLDGDLDAVITDRRGPLKGCRWLENPGSGKAQKQLWENHWIGASGKEAMFMMMADIDSDGVEEALVTECTEQTIRIFKKIDKSAKHWSEKIINLPASFGRVVKSVTAGDLNGNGSMDLVISSETRGEERHGLIWLEGASLENVKSEDFRTISGVHLAKYDKVELIDLDEDGDLDILTCEENFGINSEGLGVIWYENQMNK